MITVKNPTLRYTLMRLGVFLGCLVVVHLLALAGVVPSGVGSSNALWIPLLALVISAPLSFILLRGQRDAMSEQIADGYQRARRNLRANQSMEDEADEAARRAAG
ncbi:DUF4229 domain-containing protein [Streptomyces sp. YIM 98790]|uniref:DUF4229 domain-containing protein n=1 Tax=Streptomyces sp. YIM 98790 TaxID=2689077 RepID=UPI0028BD5C73|nr:DUF4229 domain-containing protein [Streptomyces sp. YIM 98790]